MDGLPDDVLVAVLQLLPLKEVVRARRVCRRWRDIALHPDLWRHHCLSDSSPNFTPTLRLAPCVEKLTISNVLAAIVIRNQASLGRLRKLQLILHKEAANVRGAVDLFAEIHRLEGLTALHVHLAGGTDLHFPPEVSAAVPEKPVASSLRECFFGADDNAFLLRPHWEFQLRSHAATLRKVALNGLSWPPGGLQASLFNDMPHLEELRCPLFEDMHLLQCARLRNLELYPGFKEADINEQVNFAVDCAKVFFGGANDLVQLDLCEWQGLAGLVRSFVSALASSGRSKLKVLCLSPDAAAAPQQLGLCGLSALRELCFRTVSGVGEFLPDVFLDFLAKKTLPGLAVVEGDAEGCLHAWLESEVLKDAFRRNPQLHLSTNGACCDKGAACAGCAAGDCEERGFKDLSYVGVFGHSAEADADCVLSEKHVPGLAPTWIHIPCDEV